MKLLSLILAAVVQVHAWQVNWFADENCEFEIQATGGSGFQDCTNLPSGALSVQYFSDGNTLQFFGQSNCGTAFAQQFDSSAPCELIGVEAFSWAIVLGQV